MLTIDRARGGSARSIKRVMSALNGKSGLRSACAGRCRRFFKRAWPGSWGSAFQGGPYHELRMARTGRKQHTPWLAAPVYRVQASALEATGRNETNAEAQWPRSGRSLTVERR